MPKDRKIEELKRIDNPEELEALREKLRRERDQDQVRIRIDDAERQLQVTREFFDRLAASTSGIAA